MISKNVWIGPRLVISGAFLMASVLIMVLSSFSRGSANSIPGSVSSASSQSYAQYESGGSENCSLSLTFPESVRDWCWLIKSYAEANGLAPDLVASVIWLESGGDPYAYSHSGAVGLMQVMPRDGLAAAFQCKNGPCFRDRPTTDALQDPEYNIAYGTKMLSDLLMRKGDLREALRSYGPMDVGYSYADQVMGIFQGAVNKK